MKHKGLKSQLRAGVLVLIFLQCFLHGRAQVFIEEQPEVSQMMSRFVAKGKEESTINGWRIKLISTTDRRAMENARALFQRNFPEFLTSQAYENPYYSVKFGVFESRLDLEPVLARVKREFPTALAFRDKILKTEFFE